MKLLILISTHELNPIWRDNIEILDNYMKENGMEFDYCGISNQDDFHNYETIINFKYKIINTKMQLEKICDFITEYKSQLDYDWYMKIRPEVKLLENILFDKLSENSINARARVYNGPLKIKYGMSVGGEGCWSHIKDCTYAESEHDVIIDDMLYIFHKNVVQNNIFDTIPPTMLTARWENVTPHQDEWDHIKIFNERKIHINVIGINLCLTKYNAYSGDINM
jgi:hypothetical protein